MHFHNLGLFFCENIINFEMQFKVEALNLTLIRILNIFLCIFFVFSPYFIRFPPYFVLEK